MKYVQIYRPNLTWELPKTEILRQDFGVFRFVSGVPGEGANPGYGYDFKIRITDRYAIRNGYDGNYGPQLNSIQSMF